MPDQDLDQRREVAAVVEARYGQHHRDLEKARLRIGDNPIKAMEWALRFGQEDLSALSEENLRDLRYEIAIFAQVGPQGMERPLPQGTTTQDWSWRLREKGEVAPWEPAEKEIELRRLPPLEALKELHDGIVQHVDELIRTGRTEFPRTSGKLVIQYSDDHDCAVNYFHPLMSKEDTRENAFWSFFAHLLTSRAHRIRRCTECRRVFLAGRRNQHYCTVRCQSRVASRKYRNTPPDRVGKRGRPSKKEIEGRKRKRRKLRAKRRHKETIQRKARKRG